MKALIFDSGPLINLSMNGLLYIFEDLKTKEIKFIITPQVKYEVLDRPLKIPRFMLGALRIKQLIYNKIIEGCSTFGVDKSSINKLTYDLMKTANSCISSNGKQINIISEAETSCLALSIELSKKGINNIIAIDERTTRILTEKPKSLEKFISKKLHKDVNASCDLEMFKGIKFIRSTELVYVAYKKGVLKLKDSKVLEAVLLATKFKGSSVSWDEINELKKL